MPDKNLVIDLNGLPNDGAALITRKKRVSFFPADSDHTVMVRFIGTTGATPFSDWDSSSKTGKKGKALTGKVRSDVDEKDSFAYRAASLPGSRKGKPHPPLAPPQLIVDGGKFSKRATSRTKTARTK
jgi:hypothetical protein